MAMIRSDQFRRTFNFQLFFAFSKVNLTNSFEHCILNPIFKGPFLTFRGRGCLCVSVRNALVVDKEAILLNIQAALWHMRHCLCIHKYIYTNTQMKIHKWIYTNTNTQKHVHKHKQATFKYLGGTLTHAPLPVFSVNTVSKHFHIHWSFYFSALL